MGYSISVAFKTKAQRDGAMAFLLTQDVEGLLAGDPTRPMQRFLEGEDLGYPPKRFPTDRLLGIHGSLISDASWSVLIFAASRMPGAASKIYYDSSEIFRVGQSEEADLRADATGLFLPRTTPGFLKTMETLARRVQGIRPEREQIEAWVAKADAALKASMGPAVDAPAASKARGPGPKP